MKEGQKVAKRAGKRFRWWHECGAWGDEEEAGGLG